MPAMNFGDAFDTLANDELWIDVVMLFVGIFSTLTAITFESIGPDLPNELYGLSAAAVNEPFTDA